MAATATIYKGDDAKLYLWTGTNATSYTAGATHSTFAISDFSLTFSKGTAEQELVGEIGSYWLAGSLSAEGSLTACRLYHTAVGKLVGAMINGYTIGVSGLCGDNSLHFYLQKCQITGFDFSLGTADDIAEGTIDFAVLYPYALSVQRNINFVKIVDNQDLI